VATAREKLFGASDVQCDAGENCLLKRSIQQGDDVTVIWINRGPFPFTLSDLVSLEGLFEIYHTECAENMGEYQVPENKPEEEDDNGQGEERGNDSGAG
jgi:hypothetical protein